jgi:hypothetical protein
VPPQAAPMIDRRYRTLGAIVLSCVAAAGCAAVENTPTLERASTVAPEPPPAAPAPNPVPETASTPPAPTPPAPAAAAAQPQAQSPAVSASKPPAASPPRPASAPRAPEPTPPKPPPQVAASEPPAVAPAAPAAPNTAPAASPAGAATLDFTSLVTRLRETKAIGVLTKLSVKNQSDDLLDEFRMYHKQGAPPTLEQLHRSYDMLFLKLLSLLQDGDPPLARDIDRSRSAIWDILADPRKFIQANLMAGASP